MNGIRKLAKAGLRTPNIQGPRAKRNPEATPMIEKVEAIGFIAANG
jgi:hypothetical protein